MDANNKGNQIVVDITDIIFDMGCTVSKPMVKKVAKYMIEQIIKEGNVWSKAILTNTGVNEKSTYWQSVKAHIEEM